MSGSQAQMVENVNNDTTDSVDRDAILNQIVGNKYRPTSPRSIFERANEYVPTKVRAASIGG